MQRGKKVIRADDSGDIQIIRYYFDSSGLLAPLVSWSFEEPTSLDIASAVAFLSWSLSGTAVCSLVLISFSSSLSPRLNGSFSATGEGSTVDNGCHLLDLLAPELALARLADVEAS